MIRLNDICFVIVRSLGNFLLLFSLYGIIVTFVPLIEYQIRYCLIELRGVHFNIVDPSSSSKIISNKNFNMRIKEVKNIPAKTNYNFVDILIGSKEKILIPIDTDFSILIPKIGAEARIFSNIDPVDPKVFLPVLQTGIAHAKGSVFPGTSGVIYLFAHSTDNWWNMGHYNALFFLLKDLILGDEIIIFFNGRRYDYVVVERFIADAEYVGPLVNSQEGAERVVLQTCWPPGSNWKRLFVVAIPKYKKFK